MHKGWAHDRHVIYKVKLMDIIPIQGLKKNTHRKPHGFNLYSETQTSYTTRVWMPHKSIKGGEE